jgi:SAM-dependent methyltransferase
MHGVCVTFVCPSCHGELLEDPEGWRCAAEGIRFDRHQGIPDFILPARRESVEVFLAGYQPVRAAEGWGEGGPDIRRALPYNDLGNRHVSLWRIRARTYDCFLKHFLTCVPHTDRPVLDVGAGNCWLSGRILREGYPVVAVDVNLDSRDGLGVWATMQEEEKRGIVVVRAEFDALPFPPGAFSCAIFNASLHYSHDPLQTLAETALLLVPGGRIYILDSPMYRDATSGKAMIEERRVRFEREWALPGAELHNGGFLSTGMLETLRREYPTETLTPRYGVQWRFRPVVARLLGRREPATFKVIVVQVTARNKGPVAGVQIHATSQWNTFL